MTVPMPVGKSSNSATSPTSPYSSSDVGNAPHTTGGNKRAGAGGSTKQMICKVALLDDSVVPFQVPHKSVGKILFDQICQSLNLLETDYFGVEYLDAEGNKCWLDNEKFIIHQVGISGDVIFKFCVKFYTPDPTQVEEEYTRYLFCLQLKRDLADGSMTCSENTTALLASYIVQADCGDFSYEDYPDHTYLSGIKFVPKQTPSLEMAIMENHKKHAGQTPAEADLNFLDIARRVEMYGIKMHPAQDHEGVGLNLAVAHMGILVYQNQTRINTFSWAKIRKLSFKRKKFLIKLHPEEYGYYKDTVEFYFHTRNQSKNFWKKCIEHHTFFRVFNNFPISAEKAIVRHKRAKLFSKGSSFRYSGRTQKEIVAFVRESFINRQPFTRSMSSHLSIKSAASPNSHVKGSGTTTHNNITPSPPLADGLDGTGLGHSLATPAGVPYYAMHGGSRSETRLSKTSSTSGSHLFDTSADDLTHGQQSGRMSTSFIDQNTTNTISLAQSSSRDDGSFSLAQNESSVPAPPPEFLDEMQPLKITTQPNGTKPVNGTLVLLRNSGGKKTACKTSYSQSLRSHSEWKGRPSDMIENDLATFNGAPSHLTSSLNRRQHTRQKLNRNVIGNNHYRNEQHNDSDYHLADLSIALDEYSPNDTFSRDGTLSYKGKGQAVAGTETPTLDCESLIQSLFDTLKEMLMTEVTYCKDLTILAELLGKSLADDKNLQTRSLRTKMRSGDSLLNPIFEMSLVINRILPYHKDLFRSQLEFKLAWWERIKKSRQQRSFAAFDGNNNDQCQTLSDTRDDTFLYENFLIDVGDAFVVQNEVIELYDNYLTCLPLCLRWLLDGPVKDYNDATDDNRLSNFTSALKSWQVMAENNDRSFEESPLKMNSPLAEFRSYFNMHCLLVKPIYRINYYHDIMTSLLHTAQRLAYQELVNPLYLNIIAPLSGLNERAGKSLLVVEDLKTKIDLQSNIYFEPFQDVALSKTNQKMLRIDPKWGKFIRHGHLMHRRMYNNSLRAEATKSFAKTRPILLILFERVLLMVDRFEPVEDYKFTGLYETKFCFKSLFCNSQSELKYSLDEDSVKIEISSDESHINDPHVPYEFRVEHNAKMHVFTSRSLLDKLKWINDLQKCFELSKPGASNFQAYSTNISTNIENEGYIVSLGLNISWHRHLTIHRDDLIAANKQTMSGYLLRKYKNSAGWQKLWVVYVNYYLFFYKDHDDPCPLANLPLPGYRVSLGPNNECGQKDNIFRLFYKNHSYYFRTDTTHSFQRWMCALNLTCDRLYLC